MNLFERAKFLVKEAKEEAYLNTYPDVKEMILECAKEGGETLTYSTYADIEAFNPEHFVKFFEEQGFRVIQEQGYVLHQGFKYTFKIDWS